MTRSSNSSLLLVGLPSLVWREKKSINLRQRQPLLTDDREHLVILVGSSLTKPNLGMTLYYSHFYHSQQPVRESQEYFALSGKFPAVSLRNLLILSLRRETLLPCQSGMKIIELYDIRLSSVCSVSHVMSRLLVIKRREEKCAVWPVNCDLVIKV